MQPARHGHVVLTECCWRCCMFCALLCCVVVVVTFRLDSFTAQFRGLTGQGQLAQKICRHSHMRHNHTYKLWPCPSVSLWPSVFLRLCGALSLCEYVFPECVSVCVSAGTNDNRKNLCEVHLSVSKRLQTHSVSMCCLSVSVSEFVVLCFFCTSIVVFLGIRVWWKTNELLMTV